MKVKCSGCGCGYKHGMQFGERLTCPGCGSAGYEAAKQVSEQKQSRRLNESSQPRLLTEDMPWRVG